MDKYVLAIIDEIDPPILSREDWKVIRHCYEKRHETEDCVKAIETRRRHLTKNKS